MERWLIVLLLALAGYGFQAASVHAQEAITGHWQGVASREGADLPLRLNIQNDAAGLKASITIPTLGGLDIPLKNISFEPPNFQFEFPTDAGTFKFNGVVRGDSLTGSWNFFGFESQVSLKRNPTETTPYAQEQVICRNGAVNLAGTLFVPSTTGRHPAVVFLHGSGTVTRDVNRFLADHFARRGVATLIFDKRGSGSSTGNWREADFNDLAKDALSCVQVLKNRDDINSRKIGLAGASQAGWVAPLAASMSRDIAFMILVSGTMVPVAREGWWDAEFRLREQGFSQSEIGKAIALLRMNDDVTRTGKGLTELQAAVERAKSEKWFPALEFGEVQPVDSAGRRWYRRVIDYNPVPVLQKLSIPSLWVYGEKDETVPAMESAANLKRLKSQGKNITVKVFPKASHTLYVKPEAGQPFRWFGFAPGYMETITEWLLKRVNLTAGKKT